MMSRTSSQTKHNRSDVLSLPRPGDPLVTGKGEVIYPEQPEIEADKRAPREQAATFRATKRRSAKELPAPVDVMKGIACIFVFTMMGLGDREIADSLGINVNDVRRIRKHAGYGETFEIVGAEYISANSNLIQARIAAFGMSAVENVIDIAQNTKKDETRLKANVDMLDRGGFSAKQVDQKAAMQRADLRIVLVNGSENVAVDVDGAVLSEG